MTVAQVHVEQQWKRHRIAGTVLRGSVLLGPVLVAVAVAYFVVEFLPKPATLPGIFVEWLVGVAVAGVTVVVLERALRRFLPLGHLLDLSLLFPGPAPSRFRVVLKAGSVRRLQRTLAEGIDDDPARAAETILALTSALSSHDRRTRGHSERVRAYAEMIAEEMGLPERDREQLRWSALLHDIGKLQVPGRVLNKKGRPDEEEWRLLQRHPEEGARLTAPLLPWLGEWGRAIAEHHERFDGSGYPAGLRGDEISLAARVVAVADAFETMTAPRSYHAPVPVETALRELAACAGREFDPDVVRAFLNISLARLRRVSGPAAAILTLPLLRGISQVGLASASSGTLAGASAAVGAAVVTVPALVAPAMSGSGAAARAGAASGAGGAPAPVGDAPARDAVLHPRDAVPGLPAPGDVTTGKATVTPTAGGKARVAPAEPAAQARTPTPTVTTTLPAEQRGGPQQPPAGPSPVPSPSPTPSASPAGTTQQDPGGFGGGAGAGGGGGGPAPGQPKGRPTEPPGGGEAKGRPPEPPGQAKAKGRATAAPGGA